MSGLLKNPNEKSENSRYQSILKSSNKNLHSQAGKKETFILSACYLQTLESFIMKKYFLFTRNMFNKSPWDAFEHVTKILMHTGFPQCS